MDAAERVLEALDKPLTPREIIEEAHARGLIRSEGQTPWQTLKAKLSTDILRRHTESRFMRTDRNRFALRAWRGRFDEYVADRYQKALLDEQVVVFERTELNRVAPAPGIFQLTQDESSDLLARTFAMQRREAEENFDVIQLVSAFLVFMQGRVATYKRTRRLPEARLHGEFSLLFGGHLNPEDVPPLFSVFDPTVGPEFIKRELSEELRFSIPPRLKLVGVIYDDRREVSLQHLGVLYDVEAPPDCEIEVGERGFLQQLRFETPEEIEARVHEFENWSELVLRRRLLQEEASGS